MRIIPALIFDDVYYFKYPKKIKNSRSITTEYDETANLLTVYSYQPNPNLQLDLGYERRILFGKSKLKLFYGIDLISGYKKRRSNATTTAFVGDTLSTGAPTYTGGGILTSKSTLSDFYIGFNAFTGVRCDLSKRFSISAEVSSEFTHHFVTKTTNSGTNDRIVSKYQKDEFLPVVKRYSDGSLLSISFNRFISDVSLIYKF